METKEKNKKETVGGVSAKSIAIPVMIILVILHMLVVYLFFNISRESSGLSAMMQRSGEYVSDATDLLGGSSLLNETASGFVLMPVNENGELNLPPLSAYAAELKKDRRGPQVESRFEQYDVSDEDRAYISEAAESASYMMDSQLHALALMNSVYPFSDIPALSAIELPALSDAEKAYPDDRKVASARQLLLGTDYALNKQTVSTDVQACVGNMKKESGMKAAAAGAKITRMRYVLWTVTVAIILTGLFAIFTVYRQILAPVDRITRQIREDKPLETISGLREVREMAYAYNGLLHRRDTLDSILRAAAETDALTNLPNRYAFRQYLVESREEGYTLALLMFDVNYLKQTNDTFGHGAGDELLKKAAGCISACFGAGSESNCFRVGGDEFAAVVKDPSAELIDDEIKKFVTEQERLKISISWGLALASEMTGATIEELIEAADKKMYERKRIMHVGNN